MPSGLNVLKYRHLVIFAKTISNSNRKIKKTSQVEGDMPRLKHFDTLNPVEKACDMSVKKVKMQKQKKLNIRLLNKLHICA